jgi:hypothetical protein
LGGGLPAVSLWGVLSSVMGGYPFSAEALSGKGVSD